MCQPPVGAFFRDRRIVVYIEAIEIFSVIKDVATL